MKALKFQDKEFSSKAELFKYIKTNREIIERQKRSEIYLSKDKDPMLVTHTLDASKIRGLAAKADLSDDYHYVVVNSTKILDSHRDLHVDGLWRKTIDEQQGKLYLVLDHELKFQSVVAKKEDIEVFTSEIPFSAIGKNYGGTTEALVYKFPKARVVNQSAKEWLEGDNDVQASVRMQYIKIDLALNSDDADDKVEKATYDKYLGEIANKNDFDEIEYFWVVKEARNVSESSLVLFGSNNATGPLKENQSGLEAHLEALKQLINKETDENQKILLNLQLKTMQEIIAKGTNPPTTLREPEEKGNSEDNSIFDLWDN